MALMRGSIFPNTAVYHPPERRSTSLASLSEVYHCRSIKLCSLNSGKSPKRGPLTPPIFSSEIKGFVRRLLTEKKHLDADFYRPRLPKTPPRKPAAIFRTKVTSALRTGLPKPRLKKQRMKPTTKPTSKPCRRASLSTVCAPHTAPPNVNKRSRMYVLQAETCMAI